MLIHTNPLYLLVQSNPPLTVCVRNNIYCKSAKTCEQVSCTQILIAIEKPITSPLDWSYWLSVVKNIFVRVVQAHHAYKTILHHTGIISLDNNSIVTLLHILTPEWRVDVMHFSWQKYLTEFWPLPMNILRN